MKGLFITAATCYSCATSFAALLFYRRLLCVCVLFFGDILLGLMEGGVVDGQVLAGGAL